jgi:hypothetical protein
MPLSDGRNNVARSDVDAEWLALPGRDHAQLFAFGKFSGRRTGFGLRYELGEQNLNSRSSKA